MALSMVGKEEDPRDPISHHALLSHMCQPRKEQAVLQKIVPPLFWRPGRQPHSP